MRRDAATRLPERLRLALPLVQAPMAGASTPAMAIGAMRAGALGSLACATLAIEAMRAAIATIRAATSGPLNLNFFCHAMPPRDDARDAAWRARLAPYARELDLDPDARWPDATRRPFDDGACRVVEETRPDVVSFHFGLPDEALLSRVRATGALVLSSATTVDEARWLAAHGCDAVIAMGVEAGGHRGHFLSDDLARQSPMRVLVPEIVAAVDVPVIAAGGIADADDVVAALALGASAVQVGTAYLLCRESASNALQRAALIRAGDGDPASATALTNVLTGRPARGVVNRAMRELGPLAADAPPFPRGGAAIAPLRAAAEARGRDDFSTLWCGTAPPRTRDLDAETLTRQLASRWLASRPDAGAERTDAPR